jgi:hypothetical protein
MMIVQPLGPKELIDMDVSGSFGLGAINYITKEFFMLPTPTIISGLPIHVGEMAVLMLVLSSLEKNQTSTLNIWIFIQITKLL